MLPYRLSDFLSLPLILPTVYAYLNKLSSSFISNFLWFNNLFRYILSKESLLWMKSINSLYLNFINFSYSLISSYFSFLNVKIRSIYVLLSLFYIANLSIKCFTDWSSYFNVMMSMWSWLFYCVTREIYIFRASGISLLVN